MAFLITQAITLTLTPNEPKLIICNMMEWKTHNLPFSQNLEILTLGSKTSSKGCDSPDTIHLIIFQRQSWFPYLPFFPSHKSLSPSKLPQLLSSNTASSRASTALPLQVSSQLTFSPKEIKYSI